MFEEKVKDNIIKDVEGLVKWSRCWKKLVKSRCWKRKPVKWKEIKRKKEKAKEKAEEIKHKKDKVVRKRKKLGMIVWIRRENND